jgi:HEAT repeats
MRRFITLTFVFVFMIALVLTLVADDSDSTHLLQALAGILLLIVVLDRLLGWFKPPRGTQIPPSQIAEIERLYFRCMREMLNDNANLVQVINDLQRILSIDPNYKNVRHYLTRAIILQMQGRDKSKTVSLSGHLTRNNVEFQELQEQLISPDSAVRKAVVMQLIQYGEDAVDPLIALLMDEDGDVRVHAATALGWVGGADAVQPLLVALQDQDQYVRRYAARAMCWVVDEKAVEGLIQALRDDDNYVRRYAARALGWSRDRRAIRPLVDLLAIEPNYDVREYAYVALDDLGEPRPSPPVPIEANE